MLLTRLPPEIRQFIYELILFEELRITFTVALEKRLTQLPQMKIECLDPTHSDALYPCRATTGCARTALLALPSTCRQLYDPQGGMVTAADNEHSYIETIDYRYSLNIWAFKQPSSFMFLKTLIPPQRFAALTSVMLWIDYWRLHETDDLSGQEQPRFKAQEWNELWKVVADMPRLRRLRVIIVSGRRRNDRLWEVVPELLNPLWAVTQPTDFVVWLSWNFVDYEKCAHAPFRLASPQHSSQCRS